MKKINSFVEFNGLSIPFSMYLTLIEKQAPYTVTKVGFKRDLRFWNDSPWSLQPMRAVHVSKWTREGTVDMGVYQIWERRDGMRTEVEYFETIEEYNNYNPSQESPNTIKQELGLCQNYHAGV